MAGTEPRHLSEIEIADYLSGAMKGGTRLDAAGHLASCDECLGRAVLARDSVEEFRKNGGSKNGRGGFMKRINIYLVLAVISFLLSFAVHRYFLQFLVATMLLGAKWVVDSKTTRMLIMIQEAFRNGGEKEASRIFERLNRR